MHHTHWHCTLLWLSNRNRFCAPHTLVLHSTVAGIDSVHHTHWYCTLLWFSTGIDSVHHTHWYCTLLWLSTGIDSAPHTLVLHSTVAQCKVSSSLTFPLHSCIQIWRALLLTNAFTSCRCSCSCNTNTCTHCTVTVALHLYLANCALQSAFYTNLHSPTPGPSLIPLFYPLSVL